MGIILPLAICLYCSSVQPWRDPTAQVTYELSINATNHLRIGDVIEFTCTATGQSSDVGTLEWIRVIGNAEYRLAAGRSPLTYRKTVTAYDHGTSIYCGTNFYNSDEDDSVIHTYYAKSEKIALAVEGVSALANPPNNGGERIWIDVNPVSSQYNNGDNIEYVCNIENMMFPVVEQRQAKAHLERQLYSGYQTGHRWISHNVSTTDHGTYIYCKAWLLDSSWRTYVLHSEPYFINVV